MARPSKENERFEPGSIAPKVNRGSFTVIAAAPYPGAPREEAAATLPDIVDDNAARSPSVDSITMEIPSPLTSRSELPAASLDQSGLRPSPTAMAAMGAATAPVMGAPRLVERYRLSEPIATGGMATVHLGVRTDDPRRVYAIKRLHAHFAQDEYFAQMFLDEAAISARISHQNVVTTYGAGIVGEDLILVMEYIAGLTVAELVRTLHPRKMSPRMVAAIVAGALRGLHDAHEAFDEYGRSLDIVHRDVSPQNIHVGVDGVARVLDFGIARAEHRGQRTRMGELKGKMAYMAPEQMTGMTIDRRVDVRAAAVVLWEALAGAPLFHGKNEVETMGRVLDGCSTPPSKVADGIPPALDAIVMRALSGDPDDRFVTALEMAEALDTVFPDNAPPSHEIAAWLNAIAGDTLREQWNIRAKLLDDVSTAPVVQARVSASNATIPDSPTQIAPLVALVAPDERRAVTTRRVRSRSSLPARTMTGVRTMTGAEPTVLPPRVRLALTVLAIVSAFFLAVGLVATSVRALSGPPTTTAP